MKPPKVAPPPIELTRWDLFEYDPNLALASLRIDIEKKVREIAGQRNIQIERISLGNILHVLRSRTIIGSSECEILSLIISVCNKAVHAEKLDRPTAFRILNFGESALSYLDSIRLS